MKTHDVIQGSVQWLNLHLGIPTSSVFHRIMDTSFEYRKGEMPKTLLAEKVAEKWRGEPLLETNSFSIEQGTIIEEEARPFFELETGQKVSKVGFITTDDGSAGCSPDGLIESHNGGIFRGLEIKCPYAQTHVKYLLAGVLPSDYVQQVYGSMWVTGFESWTFMSYRRGFPPLIVEVKRDEAIMEKIGKAVAQFNKELNHAFKRVEAMDKGEMGPWEVTK